MSEDREIIRMPFTDKPAAESIVMEVEFLTMNNNQWIRGYRP